VAYRLEADNPVPLDALAATPDLFAFVVPETLEDADLNGDGDTRDDVVVLQDRATGVVPRIGEAGNVGQAVIRVRQPPFSFPALAADGDLVAFLGSEDGQGRGDANGNGRVFESILHVFRMAPGGATEVAPDLRLAADAATLVDHRSVAVAGGLVFFRRSEAASARQLTVRGDVDSDGDTGVVTGIGAQGVALSRDGAVIAFDSPAALAAGTDDNIQHLFVRDLRAGFTDFVAVADLFRPSITPSSLSSDGRFLAYVRSFDPPGSSVDHAWVRDLAPTGGDPVDRLVSVLPPGTPDSASSLPAMSGDGRFVAFAARSGVPSAIYVRDLEQPVAELASTFDDHLVHTATRPSISDDGRFVFFSDQVENGDGNITLGAYVRDRMLGTLTPVDVGSGFGVASLLPDGRTVAFIDYLNDLVPGDTNAMPDLFLRDLDSGHVTRIEGPFTTANRSLFFSDRDGPIHPGPSNFAISRDGRWVALLLDSLFVTDPTAPGTLPPGIYLHDRLTGAATRVRAEGFRPVMSDGGRHIAFIEPTSSDFTAPHQIVQVSGPDPNDAAADVSGDGDLEDTVLQVLDTGSGDTRTIGPAEAVALAGTTVAFLRPESAGAPGQPSGIDLNGDGDDRDQVVHVSVDGGPPANLARAATVVAVSDGLVAALVSESGEGRDLNGDGDLADGVVHIHRHGAAASDWIDVARAADTIDVSGRFVAFITPEQAQGGTDLDGDGDTADRVLEVYDGDAARIVFTGWTADELVMDGTLLAFRASEAAQNQDLNDDGDQTDHVLQVYDLASGVRYGSRSAATPCRFEACDPRVPYRVSDGAVTFLTLEGDQRADLNRDGDQADLVLQIFRPRPPAVRGAGLRALATDAGEGHVAMLAAVTAGVCTANGLPCAVDENCAEGSCFVPPGGCVRDAGRSCDPSKRGAHDPDPCGAGAFCEPVRGQPGQGTCRITSGPCQRDADCRQVDPDATCRDSGQRFQRVASPLAPQGSGALVFTSAGRCVDGLEHERGVCRRAEDCPPGTTCRPDLIVATAADADGDGVADPLDNCPHDANPEQVDADGNDVGDACERPIGCPADAQCFAAALCTTGDPLVLPECVGKRGERLVGLWNQADALVRQASLPGERAGRRRMIVKASRLLAKSLRLAKRSVRRPQCPAVPVDRIRDARRRVRQLARDFAHCVPRASEGRR
jgi:hypothetical protein